MVRVLRLIAAVDTTLGVADDHGIPWQGKIPTDARHFEEQTTSGVIVMGYGTYEEFAKPLHERDNFVVTRPDTGDLRPGFVSVTDLETFLQVRSDELVWAIGGAALFGATIAKADELYLTQLDRDFHCTKFFPSFSDDFERPGPGEIYAAISGERTPHNDPHARGVFFGLSDSTSRVDLVRAAMEGVAFTLADARDCIESGAEAIDEVGLIGGGAKSALWTRIIAAAIERPVIRYRDGEAGPALRRSASCAPCKDWRGRGGSVQAAGHRRRHRARSGSGRCVQAAHRTFPKPLSCAQTGVCRIQLINRRAERQCACSSKESGAPEVCSPPASIHARVLASA